MKWHKLFFLLFAAFLPFWSKAQQTDSTTSHKLSEVKIMAPRPETFAAGSRQTVIDSAYLKNNKASSLAEMLQNVTAVYIKAYGIASVSFRGTGASQTAVLWNGFNLNLPSLGQTDLSLIPVNAVGSIQLQHGSAGSNYGSSAIGGAILLHSTSEIKTGLNVQTQQDFGSFGRRFAQMTGSYGWQKIGLDASVFRTEAQNDFPFINTLKFGKPTEKQQNAATEQTGFTANATWKPTTNSTFFLRNWYTSSDFQAMPSMLAANTHARNQNKNLRSMAEWNYRSGFGISTFKAAFFRDFMRYQDDNLKPADTDIKTYQAQASHTVLIREKLNLLAGAETQYFAGQVAGYAKPVNEWRNSIFALLRYDLFTNLNLNLNVRKAFVHGFDPPVAPTFGFNYNFLQTTKNSFAWKGNITRGYRVPTLNDRYWPPGNPDLKPEDSWNYESGLKHRFLGEALTVETEVTVYTMRVKNWIQWAPGLNTSLWLPQNLKEVQARGLEFSGKISYRFSQAFSLNASGNYAYTESVQKALYKNSEPELLNKQLVYVPLHTASGLLQSNLKTYFLTVAIPFTGSRFPDAENRKPLPAYALLNIYGGKTFRFRKCTFQVTGRVNNLTNEIYQNYQYYATPGRNFNLSLRLELN